MSLSPRSTKPVIPPRVTGSVAMTPTVVAPTIEAAIAIKTTPTAESPAEPPPPEEQSLYCTAFYQQAGIHYCIHCGEKDRVVERVPMCPRKDSQCDRHQVR